MPNYHSSAQVFKTRSAPSDAAYSYMVTLEGNIVPLSAAEIRGAEPTGVAS